MRLAPLCLLLSLAACGGKPAATTANDCLVPRDGAGGLFSASVDASAPELIRAAVQAGEVVAAASEQAETFDARIVEIAKDPALSASWSKVAPDATRARTAGLATDLPASAERLRAAGTPAPDVSTAIDAASKARMAPAELSDALALAAKAAETYGPISGFGVWFSSRVAAGDRGALLADAIEVEHESKGEKSGADKVEICHRPPGNPDNQHTISVGASALSAHLGHGDVEGACDGEGKHDDKRDDKVKGPAAGKHGAAKPGGGSSKGKGKGKH